MTIPSADIQVHPQNSSHCISYEWLWKALIKVAAIEGNKKLASLGGDANQFDTSVLTSSGLFSQNLMAGLHFKQGDEKVYAHTMDDLVELKKV